MTIDLSSFTTVSVIWGSSGRLTALVQSCFCLYAGWKDKGWWQNNSSGRWTSGRPVSESGKHVNKHAHYEFKGQADLMIYFCVPCVYSGVQFDSQTPCHCQALRLSLQGSLSLFLAPIIAFFALLSILCLLPNTPSLLPLCCIPRNHTDLSHGSV